MPGGRAESREGWRWRRKRGEEVRREDKLCSCDFFYEGGFFLKGGEGVD